MRYGVKFCLFYDNNAIDLYLSACRFYPKLSMAMDTTQSAPKRNVSAKIMLIPWDPENAEHIERLYNQRVACGWNSDMIEKWKDMQRDGKKAIHWIVSFCLT